MKARGELMPPAERFGGFVVTFDESLSGEETEALRCAIAMLKHVVDVRAVVDDFKDIMARERVRGEMATAVMKALRMEPIK